MMITGTPPSCQSISHGKAAEEILFPLEQALYRCEQQRLALAAWADEEAPASRLFAEERGE